LAGKISDASERYEEALVITRQLGARRLEGVVLRQRAALVRKRGDMQAALTQNLEALAIHRETAHRQAEGVILSNIGCVLAGLARILREESVTRGTEPCAKWPQVVLPEERRYLHIVAQGKMSTATRCAGLGLIVANLTQYPGWDGQPKPRRSSGKDWPSIRRVSGTHRQEYGKFLGKKARVAHTAGDLHLAHETLDAVAAIVAEVSAEPRSELARTLSRTRPTLNDE
jgi:hypothetical protein